MFPMNTSKIHKYVLLNRCNFIYTLNILKNVVVTTGESKFSDWHAMNERLGENISIQSNLILD